MKIDYNFPSGKIKVNHISTKCAELSLDTDNNANHGQWFYFRLYNVLYKNPEIRIDVTNSFFPNGWPNYNTFVSMDKKAWHLAITKFDGKNISIHLSIDGANNEIYIAYLIPYCFDKQEKMFASMKANNLCRVLTLGYTKFNYPLTVFHIKKCERLKKVWILAHQHSGETLNQIIIESIVKHLTQDLHFSSLLDNFEFIIVPCCNIDGIYLGNMRFNAEGIDLNRMWHNPSIKTPETKLILSHMAKFGVDILIDLHCDETTEEVYFVPPIGNKFSSLEQIRFEKVLEDKLQISKIKNIESIDGADDPGISINNLPLRFGCVSVIIEVPCKFKFGTNVENILSLLGRRLLYAFRFII